MHDVHVDPALVDRYARGALPDAAAWSFEVHVTACGSCRSLLDGTPSAVRDPGDVDDVRLAQICGGVRAQMRAAQRRISQRALMRLDPAAGRLDDRPLAHAVARDVNVGVGAVDPPLTARGGGLGRRWLVTAVVALEMRAFGVAGQAIMATVAGTPPSPRSPVGDRQR